jgi:hypothetical protein
MVVPLENTGDSIFYLAKAKKYLPTPQIQTGRNTFWYAVRQDGEWINIGIEDIDLRMKEAKVFFLDKEMRYARVALQRNLKERYQKTSFWEKYGGMIAYIVLIVITGVMMWLLFDKYLSIGGTLDSAMKTSKEVLVETKNILSNLDNIQSGGSGLVPAS